jgi:carbon storage regulator
MLVLTRKLGEQLRIGAGVTVEVLEVSGGRVRIGIEVPAEVAIHRDLPRCDTPCPQSPEESADSGGTSSCPPSVPHDP